MANRPTKKAVIRSRVTESLKSKFLKAAKHAGTKESDALRVAAMEWAEKILRRKALP